MLGDIISEGTGKRTGRRVIATDPHLKVEVSFEEATKVFGMDGMHLGTYVSWTKPDGTPDEMKIFRSDFYDDMVSGVDRVMSMGSILGAPAVEGSEVYFGSADGNVYALM